MTDKEYREIAKEYLEPIKLITMKINSLKEDLKHLQSDITTIGAVDYSKERLTGGGTPCGLEQQIVRLESKHHRESKYIVIARIHRRQKREACAILYRFRKVASSRIKNGWTCTSWLLFAPYILCVHAYG